VQAALGEGARLTSPYADRAAAAFPATDPDPVRAIVDAVRLRSRPWTGTPAAGAGQSPAGVSG
jgi:hypothetical protein